MTPRPRFAIYHDAMTRTWAVFDRLRSYSIRTRLAQAAATNLARDYEAAWRQQCEQWQQAEWRDALL
ncbi:MAG: hypothetical protein M3Y74_08385 [Chloroflexota bacterium]|nr:hypothetical protein [Chloroflexota bacterium]